MSAQGRRLTVFFADSQKLSFTIPEQREDAYQKVNLFKEIWSSDKLAVEADGVMFCIPWSSIKYVQLDPVHGDDVLPSPVLKGLRLDV